MVTTPSHSPSSPAPEATTHTGCLAGFKDVGDTQSEAGVLGVIRCHEGHSKEASLADSPERGG